MTDATPTPPPAAPVAAGPKQTLSLVGFILGIASFVFSWTGILGIGAGIAAIILSQKGKKTEPGAPSWMHLVGLIAGIVGIVIGAFVGIFWIIGIIITIAGYSAIGSY
jgi:hypothetical protein